MKEYAVYDKKDNCVFIGTMKEIAKLLNITQKKGFNRVYRGMRINKKYLIIKLED